MNAKILLLVIGLVVGGLAGWLTRPQAAEVNVLGLKVEVQGDQAAGASGGSLTTGQTQHVAIFAAVGALLGFGIGFVADRRR
ncbi:hypothetical protein [Chenggangzhangella methanolivorans]|uniref:Uncharacterized protein n=1 Tax=Chenggangzhangella methanolivorans TaxID=1437009 RepID=A0A9E6RB47_9HYPH|nr:hypothetical protein [Chenggangzhangella methanolivorans]QZO01514.1 hypothetical protein K6K41_08840 [Chenggangzhangella methanolivorans]